MTTAPEAARAGLRDLLLERLGEGPGADWLRAQATSPDPTEFAARLAEVRRAVGRRPLIASFAARDGANVPGVWGPQAVGAWRTDDAGRVLLVAEAAEAGDAPYDLLFQTYDGGDTETRVACLRALNFVRRDEPARGLDLVHDAGRTYLTQLMDAAWCHNPFSAEHLSDHDYRKAVLKAFFCELPVEGFLRLEERADAELAASLCEYVDERLAAGRSVPRAIWPIAALHPRPGLVARLIGMLEHPDAQERLTAARALRNARDPRARSFLEERLAREDDAPVREALAAALEASP